MLNQAHTPPLSPKALKYKARSTDLIVIAAASGSIRHPIPGKLFRRDNTFATRMYYGLCYTHQLVDFLELWKDPTERSLLKKPITSARGLSVPIVRSLMVRFSEKEFLEESRIDGKTTRPHFQVSPMEINEAIKRIRYPRRCVDKKVAPYSTHLSYLYIQRYGKSILDIPQPKKNIDFSEWMQLIISMHNLV